MKNLQTQTKMIMDYLYGAMTKQEKELFEKELLKNRALKQELRLQLDIDNSLKKEIQVDKFRSLISGIHENTINKKTNRILNLQNKWYWAAASITIFSGTAIYSLKQQTQTPERLFKSYYQLWQPTVVIRGLESETFSKNVIGQFEAGNFIKVKAMLQKSFNNKTIDPKLILVKGCAEMELGDYKSASETFSLFNSKNYTFYTEAAQWYQALCYLKNNEIEKSKKLLSVIAGTNASYANEAKDLLKKLN